MQRSNSQSATKEDVKKVRVELKSDIARLDNKIGGVEKNLNQKIDGAENALRSEIKINSQELEERLDDKAKQYRDQILTKMDNFINEISDSREERTVVAHQIADHSDRLENLEKDVDTIKSRPLPQ